MTVRQTRIFVPATRPFDEGDWVSTVVGHVIKPIAESPGLAWFHFNHYVAPDTDSGDCDIARIPRMFSVQGNNGERLFRSIRFRYRVEDEARNALEAQIRELLEGQDCAVSDFRDFDHFLEDYGGTRYLDQSRPELKATRAELLGQFLCAATRLFIHGLIGPDEIGRFSQEKNNNTRENPLGSRFESIHHLFCNMVDAKLPVSVRVLARSHWMSHHVGAEIPLVLKF